MCLFVSFFHRNCSFISFFSAFLSSAWYININSRLFSFLFSTLFYRQRLIIITKYELPTSLSLSFTLLALYIYLCFVHCIFSCLILFKLYSHTIFRFRLFVLVSFDSPWFLYPAESNQKRTTATFSYRRQRGRLTKYANRKLNRHQN